MWGLFVVISLVGAGAGLLLLSEATLGIGVIGLSAMMAVYARMAQASQYQQELRAILKGQPEPDRSEPNLEKLYNIPKS